MHLTGLLMITSLETLLRKTPSLNRSAVKFTLKSSATILHCNHRCDVLWQQQIVCISAKWDKISCNHGKLREILKEMTQMTQRYLKTLQGASSLIDFTLSSTRKPQVCDKTHFFNSKNAMGGKHKRKYKNWNGKPQFDVNCKHLPSSVAVSTNRKNT